MKIPFFFVLIFSFSLAFFSCYAQSTKVRPSKMREYEKAERCENEERHQRSDTIIAVLPRISPGRDKKRNEEQKKNAPQETQREAQAEIQEEKTPETPPQEEAEPQAEYVEPKVRVLLHRNIRERKLSIGQITLSLSFIDANSVRIEGSGKVREMQLPCTLKTSAFSDGDKKYRGAVLITGSNSGFSVSNLVGIEDYLRGVVPLEIGYRPQNEIEALKAQAVAARTYAFSRMISRRNLDFDLYPTVMDQVYGGVNSEYEWADSAILATRGKIMTRQEDGVLVEAFYHATCAGTTAAVNEVWNSEPNSALVSRSDLTRDGAPFCNHANTFSWQETWSVARLSQILHKYSRQTAGETPFDGTVRALKVMSRTPSGRVEVLQITSDRGVYNYGKDRVRFVMRRPNRDESILRSANFDVRLEGANVIATGVGFGHGIGMCQNGAMERARQGQTYTEILRAYYTQINFRSIPPF